MNKPFLLCECEDSELNFDGDAGAIGRLFVKDEKLSFDLKGRLYRGSIKVGPTILILNMAPPVGVTSSDYNQNARIEYLTNEYTQLTFEKDLLTELKGNYTGMNSQKIIFNLIIIELLFLLVLLFYYYYYYYYCYIKIKDPMS